MAEMTEKEQLEEVKDSLGVTGNYQDARVLGYLREIKQYLMPEFRKKIFRRLP